jgi:hypothetical protein
MGLSLLLVVLLLPAGLVAATWQLRKYRNSQEDEGQKKKKGKEKKEKKNCNRLVVGPAKFGPKGGFKKMVKTEGGEKAPPKTMSLEEREEAMRKKERELEMREAELKMKAREAEVGFGGIVLSLLCIFISFFSFSFFFFF